MTRILRAAQAARGAAARTTRCLDAGRYTLLQLLGLALVVVAVGMVYTPLAVGLAGVVIFAAAYFLDTDDGDDGDDDAQPRP